MKDPIEEALEKLEPAAMPPALMARLTAARPRPRERSSFWNRWLLPLATAGCAAAAALAYIYSGHQPEKKESAIAAVGGLPFARNDYLVGTREMGVLVAPNQRPYRMVEIEWLEQDTIAPSIGSAAILMQTTRREVIPVALEIF